MVNICVTLMLSHLIYLSIQIFVEHLLGVRWYVRHWRYCGEPVEYGPRPHRCHRLVRKDTSHVIRRLNV